MKLFYAPGACSLAPHIALEESGLAFETQRLNMAEGQQRQPDYLAINPKGRVPALVDGAFVVTENPAILRYVARKAPQASLWPEAPEDEARCMEWMAWASSTIHVTYAHIRRAERYASTESGKADVVETGRRATRDVWGQVETRMAARGTTWLAGATYTVADAYLFVFWLWGRGDLLGYDMPRDFPAWTAHARAMGERPAVQRALAREGLQRP